MDWQSSSYVAILFLNSLLSLIVAYFALRLRDKPGGLPLGLLMLAVAEWSFALAFETTAATIPAKVFWAKVEYLGVTSAPVFLLLFALEFTHREKWLQRRYLTCYWIIPIISLVLSFTNEWHHLIWTSFTPIPGSNFIIYGHGTWFWIMVTYVYLVLSTATILLLRAAFRLRHIYRQQAIMLFVGMFPPWLANILYVASLGPIPGCDLSPIGFALTGLLLVRSLGPLKLLDLSPVARDKVIENMRDGVLVLDAQNRIVDINPAAQELIGVDGESAIGRHAEVILAKWTGLEDRHRDAVEAQGQVFVDGVGHIEWHTSPLYEGERPSGQLIILRDITARKRAEEKVQHLLDQQIAVTRLALALGEFRDLDRLYRTIYEHIRTLVDVEAFIISSYNSTGQHIRAECVITDGTVQEVANFPPIPLEETGHGTQSRVIRTGEPFYVPDWRKAMEKTRTEYNIADGGIVSSGPPPPKKQQNSANSAIFVPMKIEGETVGVMQTQSHRLDAYNQKDIDLLCAMANVSAVAIQNTRLYEKVQQELAERKRAEREIEERRSYLESVLACAPDAIVTLDAQHRILEWNQGAEMLFGYTLQEAAGRNIDDLITGPDANVFEEAAGLTKQVLAGESIPSAEMIRYRKDSSPVNVISSASPILVEDKVIGMVAVYTDITERMQMEQQLRQQEQLAAVGQLAAGIAHDFNNLLTTIMLYAQMPLRQSDLPPEIVRSFETILDESRRAAELVQQILDFSRRAMLKIQSLDLKSFTEKVVDMLRRAIPENIHLVLEIGPEECIVEADLTRIQQALMNLATNGRDAMPEGGELRFELSRTRLKPGDDPPVAGMSPGEWVCLAVSDTGTGMTEEVRSHIFEPFFTTKEVGKGTGLGLAQVYGTIRQHEGYIGVETEMGKGATFRIYLPASGSEEKVAEEEVAVPPQGQGETILLAEDNENLLKVGQTILESLGYRVLTAANGREALAVYEAEGGVALVITDLVMPEMGGRQLMQKLKQVNPGLKGLAITGYALRKASQELEETGFLDIIHKPFDASILAHTVRRALDMD